jgi:hypothetical protein
MQLSDAQQSYLIALARAVKILAGLDEAVLGSEWWANNEHPTPAAYHDSSQLPLVSKRARPGFRTKSIFGIPPDETASERRRRMKHAKVDGAFMGMGFIRPPNTYDLVRLRTGRPRRKLGLKERRAQVAARVRKYRALRREQARATETVAVRPSA